MINLNLIAAVLIPITGGWLSAISMRGQVKRPGGKAWYQLLNKPRWTPPNRAFGPIWIFLYTAMGYASFRVYAECGYTGDCVLPLKLYGLQLVMNWAWTPIFFGLHWLGMALLHMLVLNVVTIACTVTFYQTVENVWILMLPYLAWLAFGTCLTYSIWRRNTKTYA